MKAVDIIIKKRDKQELSSGEIEFFINGFVRGDIPDYQASAFAMAVLLNGMTLRETYDLTMEMVKSGESIDLSQTVPIAVDKHSTGGVGDKTTLVVEPIVAACGLPVGKMSGRGLGFSGGTLDKMESIPGFRTDLSIQEYLTQLKHIGLVLTGQTGQLAPADGKLYALRDVTGTVQSTPLIASSVMSKKLAAGAQAIVLDVKVGSGAFMQTQMEARALAEMMVQIAASAGRKAVAFLSDMNQPLGFAIGNALEVKEAILTLQAKGPPDFATHCTTIAAQMLVMGEITQNLAHARQMARRSLEDGTALEKFRLLVEAQGGDSHFVINPGLFPSAHFIQDVFPPESGFLKEIPARTIGETTVRLGAGRAQKGDRIDHSVGLVVHAKVGDYVKQESPILTIYANQENLMREASETLLASLEISRDPVPALPLFYGLVDPDGVFREIV